MAEPATACAWSDLAACLASGNMPAAAVDGLIRGIALAFGGWLFLQLCRRWPAFWGGPRRRLFGFVIDRRPTRAQRLRSWLRELWPLWLRRCWRPLLAVVRWLLLPRG